jgi:hypothetical protein
VKVSLLRLICFDISTVAIAISISKIEKLNKFADKQIKTLKDAHKTIEHIFEKFGPKANSSERPICLR